MFMTMAMMIPMVMIDDGVNEEMGEIRSNST